METALPFRAALRLSPSLAMALGLALPAAAQPLNGTISGTLECPARSLFDNGTTQVRGTIRNGEVSVGLPGATVTGRLTNLGVTAVQLSGSGQATSGSFTGLLIGGQSLQARGMLGDQPCNLNLTFAVGAPGPAPQMAPQPEIQARPQRQPQPQAEILSPSGGQPGLLDGPWAGTVNCPTRDLFDSGEMPARGTIQNNGVSITFGDIRVQGRVAGTAAVPLMRLDGSGSRSGGASFDGIIISPTRIHARGLVGSQPCNLNLTPARAAAPTQQATPQNQRQPAPDAAGKPDGIITESARTGAAGTDGKPPPIGSTAPPPPPVVREPERPPVIATPTPRPPPPPQQAPAPIATPAPRPTPAPAAPSSAAADRLACALAGTCPPPGGATR